MNNVFLYEFSQKAGGLENCTKYLGKKFESRKGFVQFSENMIVEYYQVVVQYLKKWEKPAPKIVEKKEVQVQVEEK